MKQCRSGFPFFHLSCLALCLGLFAGLAEGQEQAAKLIQQIEKKHTLDRSKFEKNAGAKLGEMKDRYLARLKQLEADLEDGGDLSALLAVKGEERIFEKKGWEKGLPPLRDDTGDALRNLRSSFQTGLTRFADWKTAEFAKLEKTKDEAFVSLEKTFTRNRKLEDARAVQQHRGTAPKDDPSTVTTDDDIPATPPSRPFRPGFGSSAPLPKPGSIPAPGPSSQLSQPEPYSTVDIQKSIVLVQSGAAKGTGFLLRLNRKPYVVSNLHVVDNGERLWLQTKEGKTLKPIGMELSRTSDLVRFAINPSSITSDMKLLEYEQNTVNLGDEIRVLGNSMGSRVITEIEGKVLGVGPDEIEVSSRFVQGNSGSPIVNQAGKVVGVATYATRGQAKNWVQRNSRFNEIRYFGVRITEGTQWMATSPAVLRQHRTRMADSMQYMEDIARVVDVLMQFRSGGRATKDFNMVGQLDKRKYTDQRLYAKVETAYLRIQKVLARNPDPSANQLRRIYHQTNTELQALIREIPTHLRPTTQYSRHFYNETKILQHLARLLATYANQLR